MVNALASFRSRTNIHPTSPFLRLKSLASILRAMIISSSTRPVSVKSLAGSPLRKPQDFPEDVEDLRSINNDFPPIDFDFELTPVQSVHQPEPSSVCDPVFQQSLFPTSSETAASHGVKNPSSAFSSLPSEIHDKILDYLLSRKVSVSSPSVTVDSSPTSWAKVPRFSRRKKVTDLTLVCHSWRSLIQSRLYRHIELKGTNDEMLECRQWFLENTHLLCYFHATLKEEPAITGSSCPGRWAGKMCNTPPYDIPFLPSEENATMEEIFQHMQLFTSARVLILQGGHANTPPALRHFRNGEDDEPARSLPRLPHIDTFVMRGAWNLVRKHHQWKNIARALPALREWHAVYPTPRSDVDELICKIFHHPPTHLRHLNLNLEGTGIGEEIGPLQQFPDIYAMYYSAIWNTSLEMHGGPPRLRSLELSVLSCCPPDPAYMMGYPYPVRGITDIGFIDAFERLVLQAIVCLEFLPALTYLNIRFLDVSPFIPQVKPYFRLNGNVCTGLWSDAILKALKRSRPLAKYVELADGIKPLFSDDGHLLGISHIPRQPLSINARMYEYIAS
ncbi:hypothetical protein N7481_008680 [Penicillium waksmanii]|uniref:uncharacterized protein n=1 Tax=Penicillium waksmanii TaxID=69791 RepID=UPI002546B355|nr:uncharacterized protein N7481_008680 [Penicillium waksmanii]KAJ5974973.1 hypothetical protein N7481_008680 [Penicillium waksmanii]